MKKYLVTGGAGFIGSNFIYYLMQKYGNDADVTCFDKLTYAANLATLEPLFRRRNFHFVKGDITDRKAVYELFEKQQFDIVVNFAAESHVDRSIDTPEVFLMTNVVGTSVLLDAFNKYGVERYHQVSTDEVYGDLPLDRPDLFFTETTPIHTSSPYSARRLPTVVSCAITLCVRAARTVALCLRAVFESRSSAAMAFILTTFSDS